MSQATITIDANQSGTAYTSDLNNALDAVDTCHSGATAPTTDVVAGKLWLDTSSTPVLKIYNSGWKSLFTVGSSTVTTSLNTGTFTNLNGTTSALGIATATTVSASGLVSGGSFSTAGSLGAGTSTLGVTSVSSLASSGAVSGTTGTFTGAVGTGTLTVTGAITATQNITAYSDKRLKSDIKEIDDAVAKVEAVRGVTYEMGVPGERFVGVIAQELEEVLPEAVVTDENSGLKAVAYGNITALLIEAVKEQQATIRSLEERIIKLEK